MDVDDSAWPEVIEQLVAVDMPDEDLQQVIDHLATQLISHFGSEYFEVRRAKEGLHRHRAREVAAVAVAKLGPLLAQLPPDAVASTVASGAIGADVKFPWDETYPFG